MAGNKAKAKAMILRFIRSALRSKSREIERRRQELFCRKFKALQDWSYELFIYLVVRTSYLPTRIIIIQLSSKSLRRNAILTVSRNIGSIRCSRSFHVSFELALIVGLLGICATGKRGFDDLSTSGIFPLSS